VPLRCGSKLFGSRASERQTTCWALPALTATRRFGGPRV
jgi:hypothetical protein